MNELFKYITVKIERSSQSRARNKTSKSVLGWLLKTILDKRLFELF